MTRGRTNDPDGKNQENGDHCNAHHLAEAVGATARRRRNGLIPLHFGNSYRRPGDLGDGVGGWQAIVSKTRMPGLSTRGLCSIRAGIFMTYSDKHFDNRLHSFARRHLTIRACSNNTSVRTAVTNNQSLGCRDTTHLRQSVMRPTRQACAYVEQKHARRE